MAPHEFGNGGRMPRGFPPRLDNATCTGRFRPFIFQPDD